jgi:hypothetical protein
MTIRDGHRASLSCFVSGQDRKNYLAKEKAAKSRSLYPLAISLSPHLIGGDEEPT